MAYTTIDDPSAYFQIATWTGNDSDDSTTQTITNDGNSDLQPDWVWVKQRSHAAKHNLVDSTRGPRIRLVADNSDAEEDQGTNHGVIGFHSDGFNVGHRFYGTNDNGYTYVGWQWKANGGTTSSNDASSTGVGTIDSVYQANTTAGFSIVTHTGSGSAGNIAHGLGAVPEWIVTKNRTDNGQSWANYHVGIGAQYYLELDTTDAQETASSVWGDTTPSSTTFRVGGANGKNNASGKNYVTYCFTSIQGYSKFGKYTGNGSTDGTFIYTGFKPAFVIYKKSSAAGSDWVMVDNKRNTFNILNKELYANLSAVEGTVDLLDFTSNGFKCRRTHTSQNESGQTYIYLAFAENPFVSSKGVPTTAR